MRNLLLTLFVLTAFTQVLFGQKAKINAFSQIDKVDNSIPESESKSTQTIADYIRDNFSDENDQVRAVYAWIINNVEYDVDNMFVLDFNEQKEDKIIKTLATRKGVCINYALLFTDICLKLGIKSYVIDGYTKQNGVVGNLSHSWCAVEIDNRWYLFDPTWGAGGVNNGKFVRKVNNNFYKIEPFVMLKTHMPFDYLWQLVDYPITSQEFYDGILELDINKTYFNYFDSIAVYEKESSNERLKSIAFRVENNGVKNMLVAEYLQSLKIELYNNFQNQNVDLFNLAISEYNLGIDALNSFVNYRNNKFSPSKNDQDIQDMMSFVLDKLENAKFKLLKIEGVNSEMEPAIQGLLKNVNQSVQFANENQAWLKSYLSKGKLARKTMFYKVSWFGVPIY